MPNRDDCTRSLQWEHLTVGGLICQPLSHVPSPSFPLSALAALLRCGTWGGAAAEQLISLIRPSRFFYENAPCNCLPHKSVIISEWLWYSSTCYHYLWWKHCVSVNQRNVCPNLLVYSLCRYQLWSIMPLVDIFIAVCRHTRSVISLLKLWALSISVTLFLLRMQPNWVLCKTSGYLLGYFSIYVFLHIFLPTYSKIK